MEFTLKIRLGNDAMQTPEDVADALERAASKIRRFEPLTRPTHAFVIDSNGNTVGRWELSE